jgi:hypothetical protein
MLDTTVNGLLTTSEFYITSYFYVLNNSAGSDSQILMTTTNGVNWG